MVFCKQLGFEGATFYSIGSFFGPVVSKFSMDGIKCQGSEGSLLECDFSMDDDCNVEEAAGVVCDNRNFRHFFDESTSDSDSESGQLITSKCFQILVSLCSDFCQILDQILGQIWVIFGHFMTLFLA